MEKTPARSPSLATRIESAELWLSSQWVFIGVVIVLAGLAPRFYYARILYLNPDEALYWLAASQSPGTWLAWNPQAALVTHPPLFTWLLHAVLSLTRSQLGLRIISIVSGALFPWFAMLWVRRFAGTAAALSALLLLTFSPALISLSTEVRAYSLSFLFAAISLNMLDRALERRDPGDLAWFHLFLYLAILSEYSNIWLAVAVGIYALVRLWKQRMQRQMWIVWLTGQAIALVIYAALYFIEIRHWLGDISAGAINDWLRAAYLQPGDNVFAFAITRSLGQFIFLFGGTAAAIVGAGLFLWGLYRLLRINPIAAVLLMLPFVAACLGAIFHILPYGATRHTAFSTIFSAAGIGEALAIFCRKKILPILLAAVVLIPVWLLVPIQVSMTIPEARHRVVQMRDTVEFLRARVPAGSTVVTDVGTAFMLTYYFQSSDYSIQQTDPYRIRQLGALNFIPFPVYSFTNDAQLHEALTKVRHDFHPAGPLWVAAGGFDIGITNPAATAEPFEQAVAVFKAE